jgi:hypothetical protein
MFRARISNATGAASTDGRCIRTPVAVAALTFVCLGMTCSSGNARPPGDTTAAARSDRASAESGRYIVTLRPIAGDSARPTRSALESRLSPAALQASGGRVVDAVLVLNALVLDGVRDPDALRRDPSVVSVVPDREHSPH